MPVGWDKRLSGTESTVVKSLDEAIQWALRAPSGLGSDDVLEIRQLTGAGDLPPEILEIIRSTAPN